MTEAPITRGTAADHPFHPDREWPFRSAAGLVRWVLGPGRRVIDQRIGIDYSRVRAGRDAWALADGQERFAMALLCIRGIEPADRAILDSAYGPSVCGGASDAEIADALCVPETRVRHRRQAALRLVASAAREWGLMPPERA